MHKLPKPVTNCGKNLIAFRRSHNLSQYSLAALAGCSRNLVAAIEQGVRHPSMPLLAKFKEIFNCTYGHLLD